MFPCTCIVVALSIMMCSLIFQVLASVLIKQSILHVPFPAACLDLCTSHGSPALPSPYSLIIQIALTWPSCCFELEGIQACLSISSLSNRVLRKLLIIYHQIHMIWINTYLNTYNFLSLIIKHLLCSHPFGKVYLNGGIQDEELALLFRKFQHVFLLFVWR